MTSYIWSWFYPTEPIKENEPPLEIVVDSIDNYVERIVEEQDNEENIILDIDKNKRPAIGREYPYLDKVTNKPYILPTSMPVCMIPVTLDELNDTIKGLKKIEMPKRCFVFRSSFAIELYNVCKRKGIFNS
jgi:hypothetical protein